MKMNLVSFTVLLATGVSSLAVAATHPNNNRGLTEQEFNQQHPNAQPVDQITPPNINWERIIGASQDSNTYIQVNGQWMQVSVVVTNELMALQQCLQNGPFRRDQAALEAQAQPPMPRSEPAENQQAQESLRVVEVSRTFGSNYDETPLWDLMGIVTFNQPIDPKNIDTQSLLQTLNNKGIKVLDIRVNKNQLIFKVDYTGLLRFTIDQEKIRTTIEDTLHLPPAPATTQPPMARPAPAPTKEKVQVYTTSFRLNSDNSTYVQVITNKTDLESISHLIQVIKSLFDVTEIKRTDFGVEFVTTNRFNENDPKERHRIAQLINNELEKQ